LASDVKWIKICSDIFDDEKIMLIENLPSADSIIVIWFKLLCLAGKNNNSGVFILNDKIAYTDEMLATVFRRDINTVRLALKTFENYGMIEIVSG
jgi:predicted phage replisome organizer